MAIQALNQISGHSGPQVSIVAHDGLKCVWSVQGEIEISPFLIFMPMKEEQNVVTKALTIL